MGERILALVAEPVSGDALRYALGEQGDVEDAEVLVVAPALNSRFRFWISDPDPAIERAETVQEETVDRLADAGIDAAGDTGESDPLQAIEDALTTFDADEIVLFSHVESDRNWLEEGLVDEVRARFDGPVRHLAVESSD